MDSMKVVIFETLPTIEKTLVDLLEAIPFVELIDHEVNNTENALNLIYTEHPDIIILENDFPGIDSFTFTQIIRKETVNTQVIIIAEVVSVESVRLAMRAGACDFISYKNLTVEELTQALEHAGQLADEERDAQNPPEEKSKASLPKSDTPDSDKTARIIALYSPKGGAGVSTVTANLAWSLKSTGLKVLVVDGDFLYGDMAVLLNQQSNHSIIDLVRFSGDLDEEVIREVVTHGEVDLLAAPSNAEKFEAISGPDFEKILKELSQLDYDFLLINTSSHLSDPTLVALELAEKIIVIGTQEISCLRAIVLFLDLIEVLSIDRGKLLVVINRFEKNSILTLGKYKEFLKINISQTIPQDHATVLLANNLGVPFVENNKNIPVSRAINYLANTLIKGKIQKTPTGMSKVLKSIKSRISRKKPQ
jgi:pilus assembly protein CpaE